MLEAVVRETQGTIDPGEHSRRRPLKHCADKQYRHVLINTLLPEAYYQDAPAVYARALWDALSP